MIGEKEISKSALDTNQKMCIAGKNSSTMDSMGQVSYLNLGEQIPQKHIGITF